MKKLLTSLCAALSAGSLVAETVWFATLEVDSLQTLQTGIESFCKATELPIPPDVLNNMTTEALKGVLPGAALDTLVSTKDPIRIFVLENTDQPLSQGGNPGFLATLTLSGEAKALQDQLAKVYGARRDDGNVFTFSAPSAETPWLPANILLSIERSKATLATSKEAFAWFKQQQKLDSFLPLAGTQTLRACVNVKQITLPVLPTGQVNPFAAILGDVEYFSIAATPNAQAFTLSYGIRLKAGSLLATLMDTFQPPNATLWNGLPENAFYAYIGPETNTEPLRKFTAAYLQQEIPVEPIVTKLENALTGDLIRYLVPTQDKKGLRLVDIDPVKDAAAVKEVIKAFDQVEMSPGVKFKKEEPREVSGLTLERYSLVLDINAIMQAQGVPVGADPNIGLIGAVLSMFVKSIMLECTVKDNYLLSAFGPAGATDNWIPAIPFAAPTVTLDKKLAALDPAAKPLLGAYEFRLLPLLKQIVSMLPNVKPEHINLFTATTDPIQAWTTRTADKTIIATVRVPANEVAAIVRIAMNGQAALQEILAPLIAAQMQQLLMQQMTPPAAVPPPNF